MEIHHVEIPPSKFGPSGSTRVGRSDCSWHMNSRTDGKRRAPEELIHTPANLICPARRNTFRQSPKPKELVLMRSIKTPG